MAKRSGAVFFTYGLSIGLLALILALFLGSLYSAAQAQTADLALCDRLAADPADPDKPAGVTGTPAIAPSDVASAIKYCKVAAAAKVAAVASRRALYQLGRAYAANQQLPEATGTYHKAADKGSTSAMVELGILLATGSGVAEDQVQASELFNRAAEAGNPRGVINLVALSENGGPPMDPVKTRAMLARAAQTNSAEAQFQLGLMEANGTGGPKDDVAARTLFERAAALGHPGAMEWAGSFAESGRGGPKDENAAKAYYEKAVALGDENAKAGLKRMQCSLVFKDKHGVVLYTLCN
jgi:TPR repeat protein